MDLIQLGQGDADVDVDLKVFDANGSSLNLSTSTAKLYVRAVGETDLLATVTCTFPGGGLPFTDTDGAAKVLVRATLPAACMVDVGRMEGQLEVTTGSRIQSCKTRAKFNVFAQF